MICTTQNFFPDVRSSEKRGLVCMLDGSHDVVVRHHSAEVTRQPGRYEEWCQPDSYSRTYFTAFDNGMMLNTAVTEKSFRTEILFAGVGISPDNRTRLHGWRHSLRQ